MSEAALIGGGVDALSQPETEKLARLESVIDDGVVTFKRVGLALLTIRDERLYRATHGTFEDYCRERWGMSHRHANRYIGAAEVATTLGPIGPVDPISESQLRPLVPLEPEQQQEAWQKAVDDAGGEQPTARQVQAAVDRVRGGGAPAALLMSESNEWYTPADYVEAARELMGGIDLDPASCEFANKTVCAARFFDASKNGLSQKWSGRVWMNPPYGRDEENNESNQGIWSARLRSEYEAGAVEQAVMLVNAVTDRTWFKPLWDMPICFVEKRIKFYSPDEGKKPSPTHGNVLVYFGEDFERFIKLFGKFGRVVIPHGSTSLAILAA